jgi:hypothetical protein
MLTPSNATAPGSASKASQMQYCLHAESARRQLPPVAQSTKAGTTRVNPATTNASRSQGGIPPC